jgi:hypothetical protein
MSDYAATGDASQSLVRTIGFLDPLPPDCQQFASSLVTLTYRERV